MNPTSYRFSRLCVALVAAAGAVAFGLAGCGSSRAPAVDATADTSTAQVDAGGDTGTIDAPACPASCDDKNDCTIDSCDPLSYQCVHAPVADGTKCEDGNTCTVNDICQGGLCFSGPYKSCTAIDRCHEAGVCSPKTGECSNPNSANGKACDDGKACTVGDQCREGVCAGAARVCAGQNTCDQDSGVCTNPMGLPVFPAAISGFVFEDAYGPTSGNGLVGSPDGSVFVAGSFMASSDLGSGPINTSVPRGASNTDVFLARLDPTTGKAIWTQTFGGPLRQDVACFAANGGGQIGIVGPLQGGLTVGTTELDRMAVGDYYVLGASAIDGAGQWVRRVNLQVGNVRQTALRAIAGDPQSGRFVLCGTTAKAATDLLSSLVWQGGTDVVLASLRGDTGDTDWAQQIGGINDEECSAVAIDGESNIYLVGTYRFGSTVTIGGLPALPMVDQTGAAAWMFVAKLDSSGKGIWARSFGQGQQAEIASAVTLMPGAGNAENLVVAGTVTGTPSFAGVTLDSGSFVAMLNGSKGDVLWVKALGPAAGGASVTAFSVNSVGNLVVAGNYQGTLSLGHTALPIPSNTAGAFVALMDATNQGNILAAIGYGDPLYSNQAIGVMTNRTGSGGDKDTTLFLASFTAQIVLGQPTGTLTSPPTEPALAAIKLAP
jgi:hypothetical protein